jgi:oleate hydratase
MEAVYTHLGIERAVPKVFNSTYDVRTLSPKRGSRRDGHELELLGPDLLRKQLFHRLDDTEISELLGRTRPRELTAG